MVKELHLERETISEVGNVSENKIDVEILFNTNNKGIL